MNTDTILQTRTQRLGQYSYKLSGPGFGIDTAFTTDPTIDESEMSVLFPYASGERRDGQGDLLEVGGINTERHRLNGIILLDHAKQVALPVALAENPDTREYTNYIDVANRTASAKGYFYKGDGSLGGDRSEEYDHALLCEQLFDLIAKRYVRGGSIGYQVIKAMPLPADPARGTPQGLHLLSVLMLEASIVVMPANMDTVRKALSLPTVCGKRLSPVLVKSLEPYAGEKTVQMGYEGPVLISDARTKELRTKYKRQTSDAWKYKYQGETKSIIKTVSDGPYSITLHSDGSVTVSSGGSFQVVDRRLAGIASEALEVSVVPGPGREGRVKEGQTAPSFKRGDKVRKRSSGETGIVEMTDKYGKVHVSFSDRDAWVEASALEKKSLNGSAPVPLRELPTGQVPHSRWKPGAGAIKDGPGRLVTLKEIDEAGERLKSRRQIKDIRGKYRRAKGNMVRRKRGSPGVAIVHVRRKDVQCVAALADRWGLKMERMGASKDMTDSEKLRLSGDDSHIESIAAKYGVRTMGSKSLNGKTKTGPTGGRPIWRKENRGGKWWVLSQFSNPGSHKPTDVSYGPFNDESKADAMLADLASRGEQTMKSMKNARTKANEPDDLENQEPAETPEQEAIDGDYKDLGEGEPDEKYSAQVIRHMHEEAQRLLADYDELGGPLEHDATSDHLRKKCESLVAELEELEALFAKHHPDAKQLAGDEAEPGPDDALPEDSEREEEPTPEEAIEGMDVKTLRRQLTKHLTGKYGKKGMDRRAYGDAVAQLIAKMGIPAEVAERDYDALIQASWASAKTPESVAQQIRKFEGKSLKKSTCPECGKADCNCGSKDLTEDEAAELETDAENLSEDIAAETSDIEDKSMKALEDNDYSAVNEAKDYLSEVSNTQDDAWTDEHRHKAYMHHKSLGGLAGTAVGAAVGGPVGGAVGGAIGEAVAGDKGLKETYKGREIYTMSGGSGGFWIATKPQDPDDMIEGPFKTVDEAKREIDRKGKSLHKAIGEADEFHKDYREEGMSGEEMEEEVNEQDDTKSMHPHRKACSSVSQGMKALADVKPGEFNEEHRQKSMEWHKALDDIKPEESLDEAEATVEEPGDMGEKNVRSKAVKSLKHSFSRGATDLAHLRRTLDSVLR